VYLQQITLIMLDMTMGHVCIFGSYYPLDYCCWKVEMVRHGRTTCIIMCYVIFLMLDGQIDPSSTIVHVVL